MGCYEFEGKKPLIAPTAFIHPMATIIGSVQIGHHVYIGAGAVIRGDWASIIIEDGCNVQENCVIHQFPNVTTTLHTNVHIGHGAIIHGATIERDVLIGMNTVIMDHATIGAGSIIGALTFIGENKHVPPRKVVAGNPYKVIRDVSDSMFEWKKRGTELYQTLPSIWRNNPKECNPNIWDKPQSTKATKVNPSEYLTWLNNLKKKDS